MRYVEIKVHVTYDRLAINSILCSMTRTTQSPRGTKLV